MLKSTYDVNNHGYVDQAAALTDGTNTMPYSSVANKADKATTLAGYGIANAYTKSEANTLLGTKITEPDADGTAGQALITDGNGGRSWGDVDSLVKSVESTEFAVSGAGKLSLNTDVADAIDDIANKADRDQITSASDVWVTPHTGGYKVGDIVIHNNTIYECITAQAQGSEVSPTAASGSTYWTASSVLSALKSSLAKRTSGDWTYILYPNGFKVMTYSATENITNWANWGKTSNPVIVESNKIFSNLTYPIPFDDIPNFAISSGINAIGYECNSRSRTNFVGFNVVRPITDNLNPTGPIHFALTVWGF